MPDFSRDQDIGKPRIQQDVTVQNFSEVTEKVEETTEKVEEAIEEQKKTNIGLSILSDEDLTE